MSYNAPLSERIRIQIEILGESCADALGSYAESLRRPLLLLASVALLMTLRAGRRGVAKMRSGIPTDGMRMPTTYKGATAGGLAGRPLGGYGVGGGNAATAAAYGQQRSMVGGVVPGGAAGMGTTTAALADMHGSTVHVLEGGLLNDYGSVTEFQGQIETVQGFEAPGLVEQILQQPGQGKVLVVDGGGSMRAAVFDSNLAALAQRNGWGGVIINGAVRNAKVLAMTPVGIKAIGTHPIRGRATMGNKGGSITLGGIQFNPGWWVYADKDGIIVSERNLGVGGMAGGQAAGGQMMGVNMGGPQMAGGQYGATGAVGAPAGMQTQYPGTTGMVGTPNMAGGTVARPGMQTQYPGTTGTVGTPNMAGGTVARPGMQTQYPGTTGMAGTTLGGTSTVAGGTMGRNVAGAAGVPPRTSTYPGTTRSTYPGYSRPTGPGTGVRRSKPSKGRVMLASVTVLAAIYVCAT